MRKTLVLLVVVPLLACAPDRGDAYKMALAEATRAETAGRYREASERFDAASKAAKVPRDGVYTSYLAALMVAKDGDVAAATARLEALGLANPPSPYSAVASFKAAQLRIANGDAARGHRDMERVVRTFPDAGIARTALHHVLSHIDETGGKPKSIEYLSSLEKPLADSTLADAIAYERAKRLADLGQTEAAKNAFLDVAARWPYPKGVFFDDSLYRASELDEALGHYAEAIADLERMLLEREDASFVGSYELPRYSAAILRIADLYETKLHDRVRAREALHRLYADFKTSTSRDDALFREASLWRDDGQADTACSRLETLVADFPDSRYVPCAIEQCPKVKRSDKSRAPKSCHAYLVRKKTGTEPTP